MIHYDEKGTRLGFWLFLYTELFLFAALFLIYAVYRSEYLEDFQAASGRLSIPVGTANTMVLLLSSLTVVLALVALRREEIKRSFVFLGITIACAFTFLIVKSFEWTAKFQHGFFLSSNTTIEAGEASPLFTVGEQMLPKGEVLFYSLYFIMTGIHAIHIIIGMILFFIAWKKMSSGVIHSHRVGTLENFGLYWHLVDVVWIFLFPLFYLVA